MCGIGLARRVKRYLQRGRAAIDAIRNVSVEIQNLTIAIALASHGYGERLWASPGCRHRAEREGGVVVIDPDKCGSGSGARQVESAIGGLVNARVSGTGLQGGTVVDVDGR